jgi:hypothetical protein
MTREPFDVFEVAGEPEDIMPLDLAEFAARVLGIKPQKQLTVIDQENEGTDGV